MTWFTGLVLYTLIWWTALFAVLPFGTRPVARPDEASGWRGAPERPRLLLKLVATSIVAAILWYGAYLIITSDVLSFRHGWLALPDN
jgi:predicted secreted protein